MKPFRIALTIISVATSLHAQKHDTVLVAFSLSGGSSFGSYQSGLVAAVLDFMKFSNQGSLDSIYASERLTSKRYRLYGTVGASAGAINAFLVPLIWCGGDRAIPSQSLLWQAWIPVGTNQLMPDGPMLRADEGIFSRRYFRKRHEDLVRAQLARVAAGSGCLTPVRVGFSLTSETAVMLPVGASPLVVPVQRAAAAFDIGLRGVESVRDSEFLRNTRIGRAISVSDSTQLAAIMQTIYATSAFPVAFAPVFLQYDTYQGNSLVRDSAAFFDGGVFDNNPLPLLRELYSSTQEKRAPWIVYVAPDARPHEKTTEGKATPPKVTGRYGFNQLMGILANSVPAARSYELHAYARNLGTDSTWFANVHPTFREPAVFGSALGGFGAFLSRSFREYDFIAGYADGLAYAAREWACNHASCSGPYASHRAHLMGIARLVERSHTGAMVGKPQNDSNATADPVFFETLKTVINASSADSTTVESGPDSTLRRRFLDALARNARIIDSTEERRAKCELEGGGIACTSGLQELLERRLKPFQRAVRRVSARCSWDDRSLEWKSSTAMSCADSGFVEPYLANWMLTAVDQFNGLVEKVTLRGVRATGSRAYCRINTDCSPLSKEFRQAAYMGVWLYNWPDWKTRFAIRGNWPGAGSWLRSLPMSYHLTMPTGALGGYSTSYLTWRAKYDVVFKGTGPPSKVGGALVASLGEHAQRRDHLDSLASREPSYAWKMRVGPAIRFGLRGLTLEAGCMRLVPEFRSWKRWCATAPSYVDAHVLNLFSLGLEWTDPRTRPAQPRRVRVGVSDIHALLFLAKVAIFG